MGQTGRRLPPDRDSRVFRAAFNEGVTQARFITRRAEITNEHQHKDSPGLGQIWLIVDLIKCVCLVVLIKFMRLVIIGIHST